MAVEAQLLVLEASLPALDEVRLLDDAPADALERAKEVAILVVAAAERAPKIDDVERSASLGGDPHQGRRDRPGVGDLVERDAVTLERCFAALHAQRRGLYPIEDDRGIVAARGGDGIA